MKQGLFSLCICLGVVSLCDAQSTSYLTGKKSHDFYGVSAGLLVVGIANQNNYGLQEMAYSIPMGYSVGATIGKDWKRRHRLEVGIQYATQGQSYADEINAVDAKKKIKMSYLQIPLVYKYGVYLMSDTKREYLLHLGVGLQGGYLLTSDIEWTQDGDSKSMYDFLTSGPNAHQRSLESILGQDGEPDAYKDLYQDWDASGVATLGVVYKSSLDWMLELEFRATYGMIDINDEDWRYNNRNDEYGASKNFSSGIRVSWYRTLWH